MHQVHVLQPVLLAKQIHFPLAPAARLQVRAAGRGQLQFVAAPHEVVRSAARRHHARLGGRQSHVQRWHAQANAVHHAVARRGPVGHQAAEKRAALRKEEQRRRHPAAAARGAVQTD